MKHGEMGTGDLWWKTYASDLWWKTYASELRFSLEGSHWTDLPSSDWYQFTLHGLYCIGLRNSPLKTGSLGSCKEGSTLEILVGGQVVSALWKCQTLKWKTKGPPSELVAWDKNWVNMCENLRTQNRIVYRVNQSMQYNHLCRWLSFSWQKA